MASRIDVDAALKPLKHFQRNTVEHAFKRLWTAADSTHRFLVADEVGLGKTLVARGVVAKTIEHLWDDPDVDRIDIVYICSNASIAGQNLTKLQVQDDDSVHVSKAGRLTLLAQEMGGRPGESSAFSSARVTLTSLTPGTSFSMGNNTGQAAERVLMLKLLLQLPELQADRRLERAANALLRVGVSEKNWARYAGPGRLEKIPVSKTVLERFVAALRNEEEGLGQEMMALLRMFDQWRQAVPAESDWNRHLNSPHGERLRSTRNRVVGRLRHLLARLCLQELAPDLVILDEFQRFKDLLKPPNVDEDGVVDIDSDRALAQALFEHSTEAGHVVPVLLLSATPYRLYTRNSEKDDDHYGDFIATTRFLMSAYDDSERIRKFKKALGEYRQALVNAARGHDVDLQSAKTAVEEPLRAVMARTERVESTAERNSMVQQLEDDTSVQLPDVQQFMAIDKVFRAVGSQDPIGLWKASPYLLHFMRGYRFNRDLDEAVDRGSSDLQRALTATQEAHLAKQNLERFQAIEPGHPKLRAFQQQVLGADQWKLLWVPPSLPYWPLEGAFSGSERFTKRLVFSAWNVVPDALSALVSYAAERKMTGATVGYNTDTAQPLRVGRKDADLEGQRNLLLIYPCLWLADAVDPREALAAGVSDIRSWVRQRIRARLNELYDSPLTAGEQVTFRRNPWVWAASVAVEKAPAAEPSAGHQSAEAFLQGWRFHAGTEDEPVHFGEHKRRLLSVAAQESELGPIPGDLVDVLVDVALGSPAVLAARTLRTTHDEALTEAQRRAHAARIATSFWSLFNRPEVVALLNQAYAELGGYWHRVLRYCRDGNLQAVLDEYFHQLRDEMRWKPKATTDSIAESAVTHICGVVTPIRSRVKARFLSPSLATDDLQIRTRFALRFGHTRGSDDKKAASQDAVRRAFNSPFRPFVLASTSVGQEGLDFHPWCHAITHWSLPGNPVDLEQREGRVHRFKGHAVRRNVALDFGPRAIQTWRPGVDLWDVLFDLADADRGSGTSDLIPCWVYEGHHPEAFRVLRDVPLMPLSREKLAFEELMLQLARYRVVFGQPRQQEMVAFLANQGVEASTLEEWAISLEPPAAKHTDD